MVAAQNISAKGIGSKSFFGPAVDVACLGGVSIAFYLILQVCGMVKLDPAVAQIAAAASIICNHPHYSATYYRTYRSFSEVKKYPYSAVLVPILLLVFAVASYFDRYTLAPWFCKVYLTLNGYHYSGQTYGIALVTAGREGVVLNPMEKFCVLAPVYLSFLFLMLSGEVTRDPRPFYGIDVPSLGISAIYGQAALALFFVSLAAYVVMNLRLFLKNGRCMPFISHMVVGTQLTWFMIGTTNPIYYYFVPFFHCLQYLLVTAYYDFKEKVVSSEGIASVGDYFKSFSFGRYYVLQIIGGALLFTAIPFFLELATDASVAKAALINALVIASINLHHFILDGSVWKLRKPEVRKQLVT